MPPVYARDDAPDYNGKPKFYGNQWYWGRELEHPGDSTPYSDAIIRTLVQANAALAEVMGWPAARSIHHKEHSPRKIDLSWTGDLRAEVGKALTCTTPSSNPAIPQEGAITVIVHTTTSAGNAVYGLVQADGIHYLGPESGRSGCSTC